MIGFKYLNIRSIFLLVIIVISSSIVNAKGIKVVTISNAKITWSWNMELKPASRFYFDGKSEIVLKYEWIQTVVKPGIKPLVYVLHRIQIISF